MFGRTGATEKASKLKQFYYEFRRNGWVFFWIILMFLFVIAAFGFGIKVVYDCGFKAWLIHGDRLPWLWLFGECTA